MAITLITGLPGHGKTLYTLARWKPEAEKEGRPVFHNNIPGLAIPAWRPWDVEKWQDLPPGAILIVDEAQFAFPVTGRGQTPDWVQKLATHRHLGLDIVVITQDPMLLDNFVRRLVDRHFHVVRKFGTKFATVYEYVNGVKQDVAKSRGTDAIRHEWRYPKEVFDWYKSSELHTVKSRVPFRFWLMLAMPLVFIAATYVAYLKLSPAKRAEAARQAETQQPQRLSQAGEGAQLGNGAARGQATPVDYVAAYTPRLPGLPHTAPAYDGVTAPQQAPYPAACIASAKRCQCYTQQGTRMDMTDQLCRKLSDGGFFVAWTAAGDRVQQAQEPRQAASEPARQGVGQSAGTFGPSAPIFTAQSPPVDEDAGSLPRRVRRVAQPQ